MSDRQSVKRGHDDNEKIPEKKIKEEHDFNETECVVCREDFKDRDDIRKLKCGHKFHEECLNIWLHPRSMPDKSCPTCLTNITLDDEAKYQSNRDTEIVKLNPDHYDIPLFFGAVVCLNGEIIRKYFNVDLNLSLDSSVGDLRTAVLNELNENTDNISSSFAKPKFKINKMYYGIPANCGEIKDLYTVINPAQSRRTLIDVYKHYNEKIQKYILNIDIKEREGTYESKEIDEDIKDIYYLYEIEINGVYKQTDYIYNKNNPDVPAEYIVQPSNFDNLAETISYGLQPEEIRIKSTYNRIAWLVFEVEENRGASKGGSTRKKRRANKKKSRKHK